MVERTLKAGDPNTASSRLDKGKGGRRGKKDGEPRTGAKANKEAMAAM